MKFKSGITLQEIFFFLLLISLTVAFFNIISPFFSDIFLTIVLVILFKKPYAFFKRKFKGRRKLAATTTILLVILLIVIPLFFIGLLITNEATQAFDLIQKEWPALQAQIISGDLQDKFKDIPFVGEEIAVLNIEDYQVKINEGIATVTQTTLAFIQSTFAGLLYMFVHTFVILFLMYFMLIDGKTLIKRLQYLIPLSDEHERELFTNVEKVTDAIVFNSFMLGIIEGTFGGLLFAALGIHSPVFWGFIMVFLSVIPLLGTNTILVPVAIFYFIIGSYTTGIIILVVGSGAVIINQNIIRPRLDGNKSGMHTAIVFLASLGGLLWMGIIGFLAGPLLMALFLAVWNQYGEKYKMDLEEFNKGDIIRKE